MGWETIKKRIEYLGLSIFHKIHCFETRPLIRKCLTKLDIDRQHYLRSKGGYFPYPNYGNKFLNSFFPFISRIWNNLPTSSQNLSLYDFKDKIKIESKPPKYKYFNIGPKDTNSLMTRFRTGRTNLNSHNYTIGKSDDPSCLCHAKQETSEHYILDCFLYTAERQILFDLVEHIIPKFSKLTKKENFKF